MVNVIVSLLIRKLRLFNNERSWNWQSWPKYCYWM